MKLTVIAAAITVVIMAVMVMALSSSPAMAQEPAYESPRECVEAHYGAYNVYEECKPGGKYNPYVNDPPQEDNQDNDNNNEGNGNQGFSWSTLWSIILSFFWW